ncbi:hypothetical protein ABK040_007483 [Willaertia magna]
MFEHLSGFVDKVNKDFERKQINRIKERLKSSTTEDEEFEINELSSPTIKKIIDLENLKEQSIILSKHIKIINSILLFILNFQTNENILNYCLINNNWNNLIKAHRSLFIRLNKKKKKHLFFSKHLITQLPSYLLEIPFTFHSLSGVNQTKIVLKLDTQPIIYISFYKILFQIFEYLFPNNNQNENLFFLSNNENKLKQLFNLKLDYQSLLFNLRNHFFYNGCFVLFCHGGHFASCYFEKNKKDKQINSLEKDSLVPTLHKTFHAYVTRKKQGKRQVAKDQSKRCKSVGSEIRRLQEEHFKLKSRKFLSDWSNVLSKRETIILSQTPGPYNEYTIFNKGGDEFKVNTNSSVVDNEEDEELKIVKSKENKYEEYNDKKYTCPFTKEQTFTIPAVKQINTSQPNHSSCLETRDEILSVWILDEIGLNQLLNNNEEESTTSNQ